MNIRRQRFQQPPALTPISHITELLVVERDNLINEIGNIMNTLANQRAHLRNIEHIISHLSNIEANGTNGNVQRDALNTDNANTNTNANTNANTNTNTNANTNANTNGSRSIVTNAVFAIPFNSLQDGSQSQQISSIEDIMTTIINYSLNNSNNITTHVSDADINRNSRLLTFESILEPMNTECPITREPFISNQRVRLLTCGHIIDSEMFNQHINTSHVCPLCRFDLLQ